MTVVCEVRRMSLARSLWDLECLGEAKGSRISRVETSLHPFCPYTADTLQRTPKHRLNQIP